MKSKIQNLLYSTTNKDFYIASSIIKKSGLSRKQLTRTYNLLILDLGQSMMELKVDVGEDCKDISDKDNKKEFFAKKTITKLLKDTFKVIKPDHKIDGDEIFSYNTVFECHEDLFKYRESKYSDIVITFDKCFIKNVDLASKLFSLIVMIFEEKIVIDQKLVKPISPSIFKN